MSWGKTKLENVLKQYRYEHIVQDSVDYKQVTISKHDGVCFRGVKRGNEIGRKRQFFINLDAHPDTLLFVRQGVDDGAIGIAPKEVNGCIATENMPMFSIENIDREFLRFIIKSNYFRLEISKIPTTGSAQKSIHERQLLQIEIPFPSFNEQKEIIAILKRVELLEDNLSSEHSHQLDLLKKLRQQILQDAVQGKLTPHDPNGEPASILLERIKAEKEKLIREKKIKKEKPLPEIKPEEIPFEIPENWVWCRLGEICTKIGSGSTPQGSNYALKGFPFFRSQNVLNNGLVYDDIKFIDNIVQKRMAGTIVEPMDLLLNITGGSLGRCAIVPDDFIEGNVSQHVSIIRPIFQKNSFYHNVILSPYFQKLIFESTTGAGREGLPKYNLEKFLVPLPPINEQNLIAVKIVHLMELCDGLEQSIQQNQRFSQDILQVALKEAIEPNTQINN